MSVTAQSWGEYRARIHEREYDYRKQADRDAVITLVFDIADRYLVRADYVLVRQMRGHPPGGDAYSMYDWVKGVWKARDLLDLDDECDEQFSRLVDPTERNVQDVLAQKGLKLREGGTALRAYHAWLGGRASSEIFMLMKGLKLEPSELDTDAAKADFRRLRDLLDYRLNYDLVDSLANVLFKLSLELGKEELALPHPPFVQAMLEVMAIRTGVLPQPERRRPV